MTDLQTQISLSVGAILTSFPLTYFAIPHVAGYFLKHTKLYGIDMGKPKAKLIPESLGIVVGINCLITFILWFIVAPYVFMGLNATDSLTYSNLAALTSIFAMLLLGFVDDCYDIKWRYKLVLPFVASIPLLLVYWYIYSEKTVIIVPTFVQNLTGIGKHLNLGVFYYTYMLIFVIFCTNAINIYAGINGIEVGQSIVIASFVVVYNFIEIYLKTDCDEAHIFSHNLLLPFIFCSLALLKYNWYEAQVFVGDSYCYYAGMTLAVSGILGHFSEEIILFTIPQLFNFVFSLPQLFKLLPCPRHRLPRLNPDSGKLENSWFEYNSKHLNRFSSIILNRLHRYKLVKIERIDHKINSKSNGSGSKEINDYRSTNLTLINLWLCLFGEKREDILCIQLLCLQAALSFVSLIFITALKMNFIGL